MTDLLEGAKLAKQIKLKESFYRFAKYQIGFKDITIGCHGDMIRCLQRPTLRKMIVMPRGTMKTSLASVAYPLWLLTQNPNLRIMLDSEIYTNSTMRMREIKGILKTREWLNIWGDWEGSLWSEGEIIIKGRNKVFKEPSLFASGIGASKTGVHADVIIADDLNTPKNTNSPEMAEKVYQHYQYYTSILEPGGILVIIGTRYSNADLIGRVISNELTDEQRGELKSQGFI